MARSNSGFRRRAMILGTLAGAAAFIFATIAPASAQRVSSPPGFKRALAAKGANIDRLLAMKGVVGVTTAERGVAGVPRRLGGVAVVVKVTGPLFANAKPNCTDPSSHPSCKDGGGGGETVDPTQKFGRPVPIGVSTGNVGSCSSGTIGARVTDNFGNVYALSNNHFFALKGNADIGSSILQPGRVYTNWVPDGDPIATLSAYGDIDFSTSASNRMDTAIATVVAVAGLSHVGNATPADGYDTPGSQTVPALSALDLPVQKYGRTTGLTRGTVIITGWSGNIGYSSGSARFVDQIIVEGDKGPMLKGGDSRSLLVTDDGNNSLVGLMFAGNRSG